MAMRWGPGPVFVAEWLTSSRRPMLYAMRALLAAALLAGMGVIWRNEVASQPIDPNNIPYRLLARIGVRLFYSTVGIQLALVMLAAPAMTAGALCVDRATGTLAHLFVTDLSNAEIILGKLAARLLPMLALVACALPVTAISGLLGGMDPLALSEAFAVTLAVAILGGTAALALSIWASKPHEVLMAVYLGWAVLMLAWPVWEILRMAPVIVRYFGVVRPPDWVLLCNPIYVAQAPYLTPGRLGWFDYTRFFAGTLGSSALLTALSVARVRAVTRRLADGSTKRGRKPREALSRFGRLLRRLPGPTLDGNPILWREWHRALPSRWSRWIWTLYGVGGGLLLALAIDDVFGSFPVVGRVGVVQVIGSLVLTIVGLLLMSASVTTSLSEERRRGSLDILLATPVSTGSIVWGKWWGTFRIAPLLAIGPLLMTGLTAWHSPRAGLWSDGLRVVAVLVMGANVLAHGAFLTSLGLALATWIKRQGRAMTLAVAGFVLIAVGWPVLIFALIYPPGPHSPEARWLELSPIFAVGDLFEFFDSGSPRVSILVSCIIWDALVTLAAAGLLVATLLTFDRCLGRVAERRPASPRPVRPILSPEVAFEA